MKEIKDKIQFNMWIYKICPLLLTTFLSSCASSIFINESTEKKLVKKEVMVNVYPFKNHTAKVIAQNKSSNVQIGDINSFEDKDRTQKTWYYSDSNLLVYSRNKQIKYNI